MDDGTGAEFCRRHVSRITLFLLPGSDYGTTQLLRQVMTRLGNSKYVRSRPDLLFFVLDPAN